MGNALGQSAPTIHVAVNTDSRLVEVTNKKFPKALKGVCEEGTWHQIVRRVEDAIQAAGERFRGRIIKLKCSFVSSLVGLVFCFFAGFGMVFGGGIGGSAAVLGIGIFFFVLFGASLFVMIGSQQRMEADSKEWLSESVASCNAFCPDLSREFPGFVFEVKNVKEKSFNITVSRGEAPAQHQAPTGASSVPMSHVPKPDSGPYVPPGHHNPGYGHQYPSQPGYGQPAPYGYPAPGNGAQFPQSQHPPYPPQPAGYPPQQHAAPYQYSHQQYPGHDHPPQPHGYPAGAGDHAAAPPNYSPSEHRPNAPRAPDDFSGGV